MKTRWFVVVCAVSVLGWSAPIMAKQGRGHGKGKGGKSDTAEKHKADTAGKGKSHTAGERKSDTAGKHRNGVRNEPVVVIDRDGHRRIVTQYYSREALPPGLAKRESLPPGLQKQLRERGRLPPGLQKRLVVVPGPLASQLPGLPPYYTRYFAGSDLIVVDTRTNEVVALIRDVVVLRR